MKNYYRKFLEVDEERLNDDLILLHTITLEIRLLNETATILWDALNEYDTAEELASLMSESRPNIDYPEHLDYANTFLGDLLVAGFIEQIMPMAHD